jgi:tyrosyl-tRNA synthetase
VSTICGPAAVAGARADFEKQFSQRRFSEVENLPRVEITKVADLSVAEILANVAELVPSRGQVRRVAQQGGLRLVWEPAGGAQEAVKLTEADTLASLADLAATHADWFAQAGSEGLFLKCGRALLQLQP